MNNKILVAAGAFALLWALTFHAVSAADTAAASAPVAAPRPAVATTQPGHFNIHLAFGPDGTISREKFFADNPTDDPQKKAKLEKFFKRADVNRDGYLTMAETRAVSGQPPASASGETTPADDEPEAEPAMPVVPPEVARAAGGCEYAVVVSAASLAEPPWKLVADALLKKHDGQLVVYHGSVVNCLPELAKLHPRYTAFVARPEIVGRQFVARIHRLTRHLNDDPYTDTIWGIVSAATPEAALRVANATEPSVIHSVVANTGVAGKLFDKVFTLSDGKPGDWYAKNAERDEQRGSNERRGSDGDVDRTRLFVEKFESLRPDAIITSGHATERNLEMPFSKGNTEAHGGNWYGIVNWRRPGASSLLVAIPHDDHPRIFLGAGNCLIGNFHKSPDSMAATLISNYGVNQFVGYTVPTWYGAGGWGTLGMWQQLAGRYSLAEAWFFNNQVITHELQSKYPKSAGKCLPISELGLGMNEEQIFEGGVSKTEAGMLWDRDVVAFYGDPAQRVTLDPEKCPADMTTEFTADNDVYTFAVRVGKKPVTLRGDQPLAFLFPKRIVGKITLLSGQEFEPVVTDNFLLLTKPACAPESHYSVTFRVER